MSAIDSFTAYEAACHARLAYPISKMDSIEQVAVAEVVRVGYRCGFEPSLVADLVKQPGGSVEIAGATRRHRLSVFAAAALPAILSNPRLSTLSTKIGIPPEILAAQASCEIAMALDDALGELGNSDVASALFGKTR
jgi:hypothetical protein